MPVPATVETGDGAHVALGRGIFHEQCASCHREDARGDDDGFVPALRTQHSPYLVSQMHKLADGHRHNVDENLVRFLRSFVKATKGVFRVYANTGCFFEVNGQPAGRTMSAALPGTLIEMRLNVLDNVAFKLDNE